jgi:hypothetical protein
MAAERNRKHILVRRPPVAEDYTPYTGGGKKEIPVPVSRAAHARALRTAFEDAETEAKKRRSAAGVTVHGAKPGLYIEFESRPGIELNLSSLENKRKQIELVAVTETRTDESESRAIQRATVFVPDGQLKHFLSRLDKYALEIPKKKGERRHEDMIDRIANLRLATLQALWTDAVAIYPAENETIWWELWLRRHDGRELERLLDFAVSMKLRVSERRLEFDDRIVTLVRATPRQLSTSIDVLNDVAEVRKAKEAAAFFTDLSPGEQAEWVRDLRRRTTPPPADAPTVCILDTGVNREHPLLAPALAPEDTKAVDPTWGTHDDGGGPRYKGHGTEMAGLALYGDLTPVLGATTPVRLHHRLESVKILPPRGRNPPELYGAITADAVSQVESQAPYRRRCFSMAVTGSGSGVERPDSGRLHRESSGQRSLVRGMVADCSARGFVALEHDLRHLCVGLAHQAGRGLRRWQRCPKQRRRGDGDR